MSIYKDAILNALDRDIRPVGLVVDPYNVLMKTVSPALPDYEISYTEVGNIKVSFSISFTEFDDTATGTTLTQSMGKSYTVKDSSSFIHDFTIEPLEIDSDQKLSDHFPLVNDGCNHLTPDTIWRATNGHLVMEYTTSISRRRDVLHSRFDNKIASYEQWLRNRLGQEYIRFDVLVINPECVVTNSRYVSQEMVDELCYRYLIAQSITNQLQRDGLKIKDDDEQETQAQRAVGSIFSSIQLTEGTTFMNSIFYDAITSPCDQDSARRAIEDCVMKADIDVLKKLSKPYEWDPSIKMATGKSVRDNYLDAYKKCEGYRNANRKQDNRNVEDLKSVIQFPFWVLEEGDGSITIGLDSLDHSDFGDGEEPTYLIWKEVVFSLNSGDILRLEEDLDLEFKVAIGEEKAHADQRSQYHRVVVDLSDDMLEGIQKVGLLAGKKKISDSVHSYRIEKKKGFSIDANVDDIDSFIKNGNILEPQGFQDTRHHDVIDIIKRSSLLHDTPNITTPLIDCATTFLKTPLGRVGSFIADIAAELCASLKQHCKHKQFILKKLRHFDVYMLIKPTDSSKHIFFSLLVKNIDIIYSIGKPWKHSFTDGVFTWTEFVSANQSKLVNLVMAESNLMAIYHFSHHYYGRVPWTGNKLSKDMIKFININALVMLHDKAQSEEIITNMRYIMMEGFVSVPNMPNPQKMIEKLPVKLKSRLAVWMSQSYLSAIMRIASGKFFQPMDSLLSDEEDKAWLNLFNPITGDELLDPYQVINTFYVGYWKNKDERPESNTIGKMFTKILELEDLAPKEPYNLGFTSNLVDDLNYHEFNADFMKNICDHAEKFLRSSMGPHWKEDIDKEIRSVLSHADIESHATLKASSQFGPEWYAPSKDKKYYRKKVVESLWKLADNEEVLMVELIPKCLDRLESLGGLQVDIFRKNQHGGLREIYVLTAEGRVIQLMLETIAKVLCSKFPSETMTHPKNKTKIPENHARVAKKAFGSDSITVACSADAKKWNQGHHVAKFAMLLCRLTPKTYHPFIIRALRLWVGKKIMIPQELLAIFDENPFLKSYDDFVERMNNCYHGRTQERWMKSGNTYVETETGMMQGILHYTSSLLHSILLKYFQDMCTIKCKQKLLDSGLKPQVLVSTQQSSDDSSVLISFGLIKSDRIKGLILSSFCFSLKAYLSKLVAIYDSPKTTNQTVSIMEFNSEFFVHGNQYRPTLRWVSACNKISETEALSARQEQMANLLTEVLEGGGSIFLCSLLQVGQALLHYRLLGSSMSGLFSEYIDAISQIRDPATGYFLMDAPSAAGLLGFKYNLWNVITKTTTLSAKFKLMLLEMSKSIPTLINKGIQYKTLETSTSGSFINSIIITWGNRKKWQRLIDDLKLPDDWLESINKKPVLLYQRPTTHDELAIRLAVKVHSPGVSESLSKGNAIARVMASSTYIISRSVLRDVSLWKTDEDKDKQSLLKLALDDKQFLDGVAHEGLAPNDMNTLFPFHIDYHETRSNLSRIKDLTGKIQSSAFKKRTTHINITESDGDYLLKPVLLLAWKWFKIDRLAAANRVKESTWGKLKRVFRWLKDDPFETLKESPFVSQVQLQNFFARLERKNRQVHLSGVSVKSVVGRSNLLTAIYQNFFPGFILDPLYDENRAEASKHVKTLFHGLFMLASLPLEKDRMATMQESLLKESNTIQWNSNFSKARRNMIRIVQDYLKGRNKDEILGKLYTNKLGIIGGYLIPQKLRIKDGVHHYFGPGVWLGAAGDISFQIEMDSFNDITQATRITVSSIVELYQTMAMINSWMRDNHVQTTRPTTDIDSVACVNSGRLTMGKHNSGCPVVVNPKLKYSFDTSNVEEIEVVYRQYTINLTAKIKHGNQFKTHNILSVTVNHDDINSEIGMHMFIPSTFPKPYQHWLRCTPLDPNVAHSIIEKIVKKEGIEHLSVDKSEGWVRELLKDSLTRRSILPQIVRFEPTELMTAMERTELLKRAEEMSFSSIKDHLLQFAQSELFTIGNDVTMAGIASMDAFEGIDITMFEEAPRKQPARSHPYFDSWVDHYIQQYSSSQLRLLFEKNMTTKVNEQLVYIAAFVLNKNVGDFAYEESWSDPEDDDLF